MRNETGGVSGRSFIPWIFVGFFAVVAAANAIMIWVGMTTWPGLVTEGAYERGLNYNRNLAAAEAQAALGWQVRWRATLEHGREGRIEVELADRDGMPIDTARVEATFLRPGDENRDFALELAPEGRGRHAAAFTLPAVGRWIVHLRAVRGDERWVDEKRLVLR